VKKQIVNDRKIYAVDTGLVHSVSFQFSENRGSILENAVFLELKRRYGEIFYFEEKKECDFVIKTGRTITQAIQVTDNLSNPSTRNREIEGLTYAMDRLHLDEGTVVTFDTEENIKEGNRNIHVIPYWKWSLG
jgi:hypothetical protein